MLTVNCQHELVIVEIIKAVYTFKLKEYHIFRTKKIDESSDILVL